MKYVRKIFLFFCLFPFFSYLYGQHRADYSYKVIPSSYVKSNKKFNFPADSYQLVRSLPSNFVKDGTVDYTRYLQEALDKYRVVVFPNFPVLINDKGLSVKSNSRVYFQEKSSLIMKPSGKGTNSNKDQYQIIKIENATNVELYNLRLIGDRSTHLSTAGEWGHGLRILTSKNIKVFNPHITDCWGDGIAIGRGRTKDENGNYVPNDRIVIVDAIIDNNRRNGISITCATNVTITRSLISNTNGISPMSGIDLEPNSNLDQLNNIEISNVTTFNNAGDGIQLILTRLPVQHYSKECNITITGHLDDGSYSGMRFGSGFRKHDRRLRGQILIDGAIWKNNLGLRYRNVMGLLPNIDLNNIKISDSKSSKNRGDRYLNSSDVNHIKTNVLEKSIFFKQN